MIMSPNDTSVSDEQASALIDLVRNLLGSVDTETADGPPPLSNMEAWTAHENAIDAWMKVPKGDRAADDAAWAEVARTIHVALATGPSPYPLPRS